MVDWISRESARKILVIGDIMLDQNVVGKPQPLCQDAPTLVLKEMETKYHPSGAAGVASNIKNMGGQVTLAGVVGKDDEGETLRRLLNHKDIPAVLGIDSTKPTTVKKRIGTKEQLVVRLDREEIGDVSLGIFHDILKLVTLLLEDVKLVSISDYGNGVVTRELILTVSEICQSKNIPVIVDPVGTDFSKYQGVDILKPSFRSVEAMYGRNILGIEDLEEAVEYIFNTTHCQACIVSWLESGNTNGVILFHSPKDWIHYPWPLDRKNSNQSCANDVFMAGLAIAVAQGFSLESSCRLANETVANL